ncbi:CAP domain-containing protein [Populibacterium corticicola]|uniref:CAP domain-containing protein n=1 Tax=Populibacterium corticicola TaxID=1812826 RepID=A0ABW5XHM7_9MICO
MKKLLAVALTAGLVVTGVVAAPAQAANTTKATSSSLKTEYSKKLNSLTYPKLTKARSATDTTSESAIFTTLNKDRKRAGVSTLERNADLNKVARAWAKKMAGNATLRHNTNLTTQVPSGWRTLGENVAYNSAASNNTGIALYYQWMKSDGHRANILASTYTHVGIGVYIDDKGQHWGTQIFATYPASAAKVTGFTKNVTVTPKSTVTWKSVKVSHAAKLQRHNGKKWVNVASLKKGTHTIKIKAGATAGTSSKYRIHIPKSGQRKAATSPTVKVTAKTKAKVTGFAQVNFVKPSKTITWKSVKVSHAAKLQRHNGKKWVNVASLKKGTHTIKVKAPATKGTYKYRVFVPAKAKNTSAKSKTITVTVK